jgi:hypothetical protein
LGLRFKKVADRREDLEREHFPPYWTLVSDELCKCYRRICAYSCLYIEFLTGAPSTDHFAPVSTSWDRVYEWDNYRLACQLINARKKAFDDVMDPFEVEEGFFALNLLALKVIPGPKAGSRRREVKATIERLGLDGAVYRAALEDYWNNYFIAKVPLQLVERRAPFFVSELRRQGKLRSGDF